MYFTEHLTSSRDAVHMHLSLMRSKLRRLEQRTTNSLEPEQSTTESFTANSKEKSRRNNWKERFSVAKVRPVESTVRWQDQYSDFGRMDSPRACVNCRSRFVYFTCTFCTRMPHSYSLCFQCILCMRQIFNRNREFVRKLANHNRLFSLR